MARTQTFSDILAEHGYAAEDYHVELVIFNEVNQVIIVAEWPNRRFLRIPVEDNVQTWPIEKLAYTVVEAINDANAKQYPDYLT